MDEVKIGEILLPGDEQTQERREKQVRARFWPAMRKAIRYVPFSRDLIASYYCAIDRQTPMRVRGILLAALAYFILPFDLIPDFLALAGYTDDAAVIAVALRMIQGHITDRHYEAADAILADDPDLSAAHA